MDPTASTDERDHAVEILRKLNGMRATKEHCDFTVKVGNEEIPAHRNVLSAGSDYFQSMLSHENAESHSGIVTMNNVPMASVKDCINFIYTGQVPPVTDHENCEQLMNAAHIMQLQKMCDKIAMFLEKDLSPGSFYATKRVANTFNCSGLVLSCNKFAVKNFQSIVVQADFKHSDKEFISHLMDSDEKTVTEDIKCKALIVWTSSDTDNRTSTFGELFGKLDLRKISMGYKAYIATKEPLVFNSTFCLKALLCIFIDQNEAEDVLVEDAVHIKAIAVFDKLSKSIQAFDPNEKTWSRMQNISDDFISREFAAVVLDGILYVLVSNGTNYQLDYTDTDATWVRLPDRRLTKGRVVTVAFGGLIYAFDDSGKTSKTVEKFNPSDETWSRATDKPVDGFFTSVVATKDFIYCIGGLNRTYCSDAKKYNPSDSTWRTLPSMSTAKFGAAAVELDGKIYVMGGRNNNSLNIVECFDTVAGTWTTVARLNNARYGFKACVVEGKIFVVGGYHNYNSKDTIEELDPAENIWKVTETMNGKDIQRLASIALNLPM